MLITLDFTANAAQCETRLRRCMKELRRRCSPTEDQAIDQGGMLPIIGRVTRDDVHHLIIDCSAAVHHMYLPTLSCCGARISDPANISTGLGALLRDRG